MKRSSRWRRRLAGLLLLILALLALAGVSALVIRFAPPWLVSTQGLTGAARLDELSRIRVALLVLVLGALVVGVSLYSLRSVGAERREENRERQLTERFMRAVDQLGHPALDVRLGGIYSLERLAQESRENHGPIIEILAAFVREHAPWPPRASARPGDGDPRAPGSAAAASGHRTESRPRPATDVEAAITVLGRRTLAHDTDAPITLAYTALSGAILTGAHLERALLTGANLEGADLFKAHLSAADLEGANLKGAGLLLANLNDTVLWGANVEGARLYGANLEGAALKGANLKDAGLTGANLKDTGLHGAILTGADLTGANLEGAGLEGAHLEGANLQGANVRGAVLLNALYDETTIWPNGFDASAQGAVRRTWPQEPAPWSDPPDEAPQPPQVGWPHEAQETSQTQSELPPPGAGWPEQAHDVPQTQAEWPPASSEATEWPPPGEASEWPASHGEPTESPQGPDEARPGTETGAEPPPEWSHHRRDDPGPSGAE